MTEKFEGATLVREETLREGDQIWWRGRLLDVVRLQPGVGVTYVVTDEPEGAGLLTLALGTGCEVRALTQAEMAA